MPSLYGNLDTAKLGKIAPRGVFVIPRHRNRYPISSEALGDALDGIFYELAKILGSLAADGSTLHAGYLSDQSDIIGEVLDLQYKDRSGDINRFQPGVYGLEDTVTGNYSTVANTCSQIREALDTVRSE